MKSYFIRMFNYDQFANREINGRLMERGATGQPVKLMAHLLSASEAWLSRCKGEAYYRQDSFPDWAPETFAALIDGTHNNWIEFINNLQNVDLDKVVQYQTFAGLPFEDRLIDIFGHVINHGTHTRAQIGQQIKTDAADKLPITDYSYYLRQI